MAVKPVPDTVSVVTPILLVKDADALVTFVKHVFDAQEVVIARRPDGKIWHADLTIAGEHLMISEAGHGFDATSSAVNVYLPDVDETYRRALAAGATSMAPPENKFYGDRGAVVKDPCGVVWSIATHVEDVPEDELKRREAEAMKAMA